MLKEEKISKLISYCKELDQIQFWNSKNKFIEKVPPSLIFEKLFIFMSPIEIGKLAHSCKFFHSLIFSTYGFHLVINFKINKSL